MKNSILIYFNDLKKVYGYKKIILLALFSSFIVIFLDKVNFLTQIKDNNALSLIIIALLFIIVSAFDIRKIKLFISKSINHIDLLILSSFLTLMILLCNSFFSKIIMYKVIIICVFILLEIIMFLIRLLSINKENNYSNNVYDLKYLCENPVDISNGKVIVLEEKEVSYDLLGRNNIINQLYNIIINCNPKKTFTIGLQGNWGSGKTTIINNVIFLLKKNNIQDKFVIVKFDPWSYDNEKAMLKGLIDEILNELNLNYRLENVEEFSNSIIDLVFYDRKINFSSFFKKTTKNIENKIKIENLVNTYLKSHNQKLFLIIDNMDRIDADKIKFLLKSISTIINFEQTIIVLLYDENLIEKELKKMFGTEEQKIKYLDKIIQLKIDVPEINPDFLEKIKNKLCNNITFNNKPILKDAFKSEIKFKNIRELKIFINTFLSSIDNGNNPNFLNLEDITKLDYIKSRNINLYYNILNNKNFYIVDDRIYEPNIYTINYDKLNTDAKEYFDKLFSIQENMQYKEILKEMFPSVKNYFDKVQIFNSKYRDKTDYHKGIIENRIYNGRYFLLYFTKNENDFIWINNEVENIIKIINKEEIENFEIKLQEIIKRYGFEELRIFMEVLELKINDIIENKKLDVLLVLYKNKNNFHDRVLFFGLDSMRRCEVIISKILSSLNKEKFEEFCNYIDNDYKNLYLIEEIEYWISNDGNKNEIYAEKIKKIYNRLCSNIIRKNINIYLDENYGYLNFWTLYRYDNEKAINYVIKIVDEKSIFRFLKDVTTRSTGNNGYGYFISKKNLEMFKEIDIDMLIKKNNNLTKDKELLIEIYKKSKQITAEYDDSFYSYEYIDFNDV